MYLILDSRSRIVEICHNPCYVRRQSNGVVILSELEQADAIYSNDSDSFYPVEKIGYLCESHTLIEVAKVPPEVAAGYWFYHAGEFYTTDADLTALALARAPEAAAVAFVTLAETGTIDEATAVKYWEVFDRWAYPVQYKAENIRQYDSKLYKCRQSHTSQAGWEPDKTSNLWAVIDTSHAGTAEDPIPASRGMDYEYGKYYLDPEDGKTYLCRRGDETGTINLQYLPHEVVGNYFEEVLA